MSKRIKMVMFYQGVPFEGSTLRSFTSDELHSDATLRKGYEVATEDKGVRITSKKDEVLIPWNNVGSIKFFVEDAAEKPKVVKAAK